MAIAGCRPGSTDGFATAISFALQYGVPLKFLVDKFSYVRFELGGWIGGRFLGPEYAVTEVGESPSCGHCGKRGQHVAMLARRHPGA